MKLITVTLFALLLPTIVEAQNRGIFIDGGAFAGVRFTPTAEGDPTLFTLSGSITYEWNDINGDRRWQPGEEGALLPSSRLAQTSQTRVAPGVAAAIGVFLSSSASLRFETAFQGEHVATTESSGVLSAFDSRQATAVTDFTVAAGWHHGRSGRFSVGYLGGVVFRRQTAETSLRSLSSFRNTISPTGSTFTTLPFNDSFEQDFESTSFTTGVMAGLDVAVNVSEHFAIVPQLRMVAFNQDWNVRPVVAVRWQH
jgi:hypothetical protein